MAGTRGWHLCPLEDLGALTPQTESRGEEDKEEDGLEVPPLAALCLHPGKKSLVPKSGSSEWTGGSGEAWETPDQQVAASLPSAAATPRRNHQHRQCPSLMWGHQGPCRDQRTEGPLPPAVP